MTVELTLLTGASCRGREITSPRLRGLLALLAGDHRTGRSAALLAADLWPDERPENPAKALQVLVSRARAQLGADVIASTTSGYRLGLGEDEVDASAVLLAAAASARSAADGDQAKALEHAEAGLALWDGPPEATAENGPLADLRAKRAPTYWTLLRTRALALARLGRRAEAAGPLAELAREYPRDEELLREVLLCEVATAGPSAALARYEEYRRALREELGTDPGAALRAVHQELLREDAPAVRQGVAHEPNPLLGRDRDLAAVLELLRTSRVVSIAGPGGLGKTRLANAVAREAEQRVVHLVPLAGVARDEDVAGEVASAIGVGESLRTAPGRAARPADTVTGTGTGTATGTVAGIVDALGHGPALLVLDNCEHIVDGAADLAGALVAMARDLRVLTTTRTPLGLSSESVYPLPELSLPTAVELFGQRARAARPGVDLPAGAVEDLCRHLDGLPLAVELAAARVRVMSVPEIARGLDDRFALLRGGARDAPPRHRTMRAVVDWSWTLLDPAGQAAMRALSIFPGGFTADAARHLVDGPDVLTVLEELAGQSLIAVADTGQGARFRMLETVREFSAAHRAEAGESGAVTGRFLAWAREFGEAHHDALLGPDPVPSFQRIRAEQDNLLPALREALSRGDAPAVAAVSAVLGGLWAVESAYARMAVLAAQTAGVLSRFRPAPDLVDVTRTALTLCTVATFVLEGPRATRALVALRRLPHVPGTTPLRAAAVVLRSAAEMMRGDEFVLDDLRRAPDPMVAGIAGGVVGYVRERLGDLDGAVEAAGQMLAVFDGPGTPWMGMLAHSRMAELRIALGEGGRAKEHLKAALAVMERFETTSDVIGIQWGLAVAGLQEGAIDEAEYWLDRAAPEASDALREEREAFGTATFDLGARAEIALARGDDAAGLRLWRQTLARLEDGEAAPMSSPGPGLDPWTLETHCAAVVAHARRGVLDPVEDVIAGLPGKLAALLADPPPKAPSFFMDLPVCGALLLALATVDLARAATPDDPGDPDAATSAAARTRAARTIALAEQLRFLWTFQPTMSVANARRDAENADGPAYADAVSEYAGLGPDELRAAARDALRAWVTGMGRG